MVAIQMLWGLFQPTLPARGATRKAATTTDPGPYFNPRSPHGERPDYTAVAVYRNPFQPTLPARGATMALVERLKIRLFQPTLPARGATIYGKPRRISSTFQPTLPARGAT